jgi:hypothetical protein
MLVSTDIGQNWSPIQSGTLNPLYGISFGSRSTGLAVGGSGTILRTWDAGSTWIRQQSGTTQTLRGVKLFDATRGVAVGDSLTILWTFDGGVTWTSQHSGTDITLHAIASWESMKGAIVGDGGVILSTTPVLTGVHRDQEEGSSTPRNFALSQNYPNPFSAEGGSASGGNPYTAIRYHLTVPNASGPLEALAKAGISAVNWVDLRVFDVLGRHVTTLVSGLRSAGVHAVQWDGTNERGERMPSGVYFYRLIVGSSQITRKMILMN